MRRIPKSKCARCFGRYTKLLHNRCDDWRPAEPAMAMDPKNVFNNKADFKVPLPPQNRSLSSAVYIRRGRRRVLPP
jgi:hypothetical protein